MSDSEAIQFLQDFGIGDDRQSYDWNVANLARFAQLLYQCDTAEATSFRMADLLTQRHHNIQEDHINLIFVTP